MPLRIQLVMHFIKVHLNRLKHNISVQMNKLENKNARASDLFWQERDFIIQEEILIP